MSASPAELTPGEEARYASGRLDAPVPARRSSNLFKVTSGEPRRIEVEVERSDSGSTPAHVTISEPSDVSRPLTRSETAAIIDAVAAAGCSPLASPPAPARSESSSSDKDKPDLHLNEDEDENGVKRKDQLRMLSLSAGEASVGSAPSVFTGSSAGTNSSRLTGGGFHFPNLHLPASPGAVPAKPAPSTDAKEETASKEPGEAWGTPFKIEWIQTTRLPFGRIRHLRNPWNNDREIVSAFVIPTDVFSST